uniref:F-box/LRR-repeat protein 15-like leucin rich repeat domain-containing protein n=1 Tax=Globisporangium ultimum (strain ATCC 200006 / CBS 805.95 / DAOM BR144) TaxID=431595 RepID=K3WKC7_GLOUD
MTDRKNQRSSTVHGSRLKKKTHTSPSTVGYGNNSNVDERESEYRKLALQKASIALAARATSILNCLADPETLDLRPYANELDDAMLNELANQAKTNLSQLSKAEELRKCQYYSTLILSGCENFTPVGIRSFIHVIGSVIRRLDYSKSVMSIDILKVMASGIEQLEVLDFSWCHLLKSDCVHEFISCCNAYLTKLNLSNCPSLDDDALGWISGTLGPQGSLTQCKRLLSLDISYTKSISDRGLAALGHGCCTLQFLNMEGLEKITDSGILKLVQGCKSLRVLSLRKCMQLTNNTLVHIGAYCRQLRSLNVCGCFHFSSAGLLAMVRGTSQLQSLNLEGCLNMREDILAAVATHCLSLQILNINGCQEITDNGIGTLTEHLPFVQRAQHYRGLEPKQDGLKLKFSIQQKTIANSAALRIQAVYRGHVDRKVAASWRIQMIETPASKKIRKSYVCWRLNTELDKRVKRTKLVNSSVVKIQALIRGVFCRVALERASIEEQRIKYWSTFAVKLQAVYRSHWTRKHFRVVYKTIDRYRKEQELLKREAAVVQLQRAFRARFHRSRLDDLMAINQQRRQERQNAATTLQRLFRSRAARKAYNALRAAVELQRAHVRKLIRYAIKLQSQWRGHHARRQITRYQLELKERETRKHNAASRINAGVRGYFGRRVAQQERVVFQTRLHAAKRIQRAWRRFKTPSAERINLEKMFHQMKAHMLDEGDMAMRKQQEILKKTRALIDQDSASEPESDDDWRDFQDEYGDQFWFSPSRKQRLYMRPNDNAHERTMLGMQCRVFWPLEQQWFNGVITRYNRVKSKHRVEYEDGDHEWLCFHVEGSRIQLFNGYCWCMATMFEPALRTLRATMFLTLRFQQYDPRFLGWRSGVMKTYSEQNDYFLVSYDGVGYGVMEEWVDAFRQEQFFQVQDAITLEWYSLSGYVFGRIRGRPLSVMAGKAATGYYYGVEDYLSYVEEASPPEPEVVDANLEGDDDNDGEGDDSGGSSDGEDDGEGDGDQDEEEDEEEGEEEEEDDDEDEDDDDEGD